jgi:hypothetical protein
MGTSRTPKGVIDVLIYEAPKELAMVKLVIKISFISNRWLKKICYLYHLNKEKPNGFARRGRLATNGMSSWTNLTLLND